MKKISRSLTSLLLVAAFFSCGSPENEVVEEKLQDSPEAEVVGYSVDIEKSKVMWTGTMLGMYSHEGTLDFIKGEFSMADGKLVKGKFLVDMNSINPTDNGYDPDAGKGPEVLVGHLSSDDFFNVAEFPTAKLRIDNGALLLTIRGKEEKIELKDFNYTEEGDLFSATGKVNFNRKDFNVSFDHPAKEMILSDQVELEVNIVAFKN